MTNRTLERYIRNTVSAPVLEQLERTPNDLTRYISRHLSAVALPNPGFEKAVVSLIDGLVRYAAEHEARYHSKIAEDGVLGTAWLEALRGVRGLLNGELGRLDGGFLDGAICNLHREAGFEGEL